MGMGTRQGKPATWLQVNAKAADKDQVMTYWDKDAKVEQAVNFVFGRVTGVNKAEKDYGTKGKGYVVNVSMIDDASGERYVVQLGAGSRLTTRFLGQLNAADLHHPIQFSPFLAKAGETFTDGEGKEQTWNQDSVLPVTRYVVGENADGSLETSETIQPFYGEGYAHGTNLPSPIPIVVNGKPVLDPQTREPMADRTEIHELCDKLVGEVNTKAKVADQAVRQAMRGHAAGQAQGASGIDADDAAGAAEGMRERATG